MITNSLFRECLAEVSETTKAEFDLSFEIAERICSILKAKNISQRELAKMLHKKESEVSKWLTGRHNFTLSTIAKISVALNERIILVG